MNKVKGMADYMKIKDVMNNSLIVCSVSDDISSISSKMLEYDIGFVPIVDRNHVIGVITDRDIACRIFSNDDIDPNIVSYMSRDVIYIDINDDISNVLRKMSECRVKRVLVSDNGQIVGTLSISDLLFLDDYRDELFEAIRSIWKIDSNIHKYETQIDDFYL